jgi:hypothetical protein
MVLSTVLSLGQFDIPVNYRNYVCPARLCRHLFDLFFLLLGHTFNIILTWVINHKLSPRILE